MEGEISFEDLEEEIEVKIDKKAFKAGKLHCNNCNKKMKITNLEVEIPNTSLLMKLEIFQCEKCGRQYLNGEQAQKLDRALSISNVIDKKGMVYERAGNFDGSNVFVRFPAQMIKDKEVNAEIMPISPNEFFVYFKKRIYEKTKQ